MVAELEQQELLLEPAKLLRVDPKLIEKWERGDVCPRIFYQARLCLLFRSTAEALDLPPSPRLAREVRRLGDRLPRTEGAERVVPPRVCGSAVDGPVLDALEATTTGYGRARDISPPGALHDPVQDHLDLLLDLMRSRSSNATPRVLATAARAAILAGWLAFNLRRGGRAMAHWTLAHVLARSARCRDLEAYALGCRSRLYSRVHCATCEHPASTSLELLDEALRLAVSSSDAALRSWLLANRAEQLALVQRGSQSDRDLDMADRAIASTGICDETFWTHWSEARLRGYRGNCARLLHRSQEAIEILERTLAEADPAVIPAGVFVKSDLAAAYADRGRGQAIDRACVLLGDSLAAAHHLGFTEGLDRVVRVREDGLAEWRESTPVRRFDELRQSLTSPA